MSQEVLGVIMLIVMVLAILLGFPTAFTLMGLGVIFGFIGAGPLVFELLVQRTYGVMTNDVLLAIPLFIFMGYIIERAGILDDLFRSIQLVMGPIRGSLAIATLLTCTIFATATGIVGAAVTLMGLLALPAMLRANYEVKFSTGIVAAGGTLGILIPPSVLLILYGATAGVSVPKLYAGAFIPGLLLSLSYLIYLLVRVYTNPNLGPALPKEERTVPLPKLLRMLATSFLPITVLILSVLGAILFGVATPTEAAAVGAIGGLVLAAFHRQLTFQNLKESVYLSMRSSAMVCWLFIGSSIFAAVFALLGGSSAIEQFVTGLGLPPTLFLIVVLIIIFLLGWPLEWTEIIVIFMPIFLPLLDRFDIDPLMFGILNALNLQTSFLSPPVAMSAFYLKGVAPKHITINQIFAGMYPYMALQLAVMLLVMIFPNLVYFLPNLLFE
ncbi:C4-dicarboxylate ABC transporter [Hydrococcus rivularis NIES-593]|uniref:C4-dicarboxylate ABC transporter n=1 Tax=Hydrococcus rivularis NIES-593 TaxID=1921803 RepID=A0A1U7HA36_9CYAN|nr:TRAP transporter large permease subunit [Hydrococcus rivularis]OKH20424.1 C4-dicarboxylate ABC transporter [Hydrococcus rivularis NIES-593]